MFASLRRWRPLHLLGAWCAYWVVLASVGLGPALIAQLRVVRRPGTSETISASVHDGLFSASLSHGGSTVWSGSIHVLALALWVAGPPLALWLVWLAARRRDLATASVART